MSGIVETTFYDDDHDRVVTRTTYDNSAVLSANEVARNDSPEFGRYKGNLVHVGRIDEGDVIRLKNMGYNLLSPDPDEYRRALLYIQSNEPNLLTVPGRPFAKVRQTWV